MNVLPVSLIVATFFWHAPVQQQVWYDRLDTNTLAVTYRDEKLVVLRDDWPAWNPQLTCTVLVRALGAKTNARFGTGDWRVVPQCGYVFGKHHRAARTVRAPRYVAPLPQ